MLTFQDQFRQAGNWHRRQFLRAGGLALGGLTLGDLFATRAAAASAKKLPLKDRSVIFLFMHGGAHLFIVDGWGWSRVLPSGRCAVLPEGRTGA